MNAKELMLSIKKGHSLLRAYENDYVKNINIMGTGIDLGAKSKDAKYYEYFDLSDVLNIDFIDYYSGGDGVVKLDLEKPFEIESNKYDFVDSYGNEPDSDLTHWLTPLQRLKLRESKNYLSFLLQGRK
jgi:hypothetical protein